MVGDVQCAGSPVQMCVCVLSSPGWWLLSVLILQQDAVRADHLLSLLPVGCSAVTSAAALPLVRFCNLFCDRTNHSHLSG